MGDANAFLIKTINYQINLYNTTLKCYQTSQHLLTVKAIIYITCQALQILIEKKLQRIQSTNTIQCLCNLLEQSLLDKQITRQQQQQQQVDIVHGYYNIENYN